MISWTLTGYISCYVVAVFDGCPRLKKKYGNPQSPSTHNSVKEWTDCALKCEADKDCKVREHS